MNWFDGRMASLDFESTGVDTENDRAVTACFVQVGGGEPTVKSDWLINPGVPISPDATAVHGITDEMAAKGQPAPSAIGEIAFAVTRAIHNGLPLIVFNAPFDLTLLDRECRRHHLEPPDWTALRVFDPLVADRWADKFRRSYPYGHTPETAKEAGIPSSRSLTGMCAHYGVELGDDAHDAAADALAAARLAWKFTHKTDFVQGRHPEIIARRQLWKAVREDLNALQLVQTGWQKEQAEGLRLYFEGRGEHEKAATVRVGWPVVPWSEPTE